MITAQVATVVYHAALVSLGVCAVATSQVLLRRAGLLWVRLTWRHREVPWTGVASNQFGIALVLATVAHGLWHHWVSMVLTASCLVAVLLVAYTGKAVMDAYRLHRVTVRRVVTKTIPGPHGQTITRTRVVYPVPREHRSRRSHRSRW